MKSNIFRLFLIFGLLAAIVGCEKPEGNEDDKTGETSPLSGVTITIEDVIASSTTAIFKYSVDFGDAGDVPADVKLRYSRSESFGGESTELVSLDRTQTMVLLEDLQMGAVYHYEVYLDLYGTKYNAVKGQFTTSTPEVVFNEPQETEDGLLISGKITGLNQPDAGTLSLYLGFCDALLPEAELSWQLSFDEDFSFSHTISGLDIGMEYQYWIYLEYGQIQKDVGQKQSYKTTDPYIAAEGPISGSAEDLSAQGTANCYIVSKAGAYKIRLCKGNTDAALDGVTSVRVLWESFGTDVSPRPGQLISRTCKDGDYAVFEVSSPYTEGNAVIAAYDSEDKILWSWHIWLTSDQIEQEPYYVLERKLAPDGLSYEESYTNTVAAYVMDRNLGALSNDINSVQSFGLMYQWGRKDPFLGSSSLTGTSYAVATRHLRVTLGGPQTSTLSFAQEHPHIFITGNERKDWLSEKDDNLWVSPSKGAKSVYDPCPAGWRMPEGGSGENDVQAGLWAKIGMPLYGKTAKPSWHEDHWNGTKFRTGEESISSWYPAAGGIGLSGNLDGVGRDGNYRTADAVGGTHDYCYIMNFYFVGADSPDYYVYNSTENPRATGDSVRCCKE